MERLLDADDKDNYALAGQSGFRGVLSRIAKVSETSSDKGLLFEELVKAFIQQYKATRERFSDVWLWGEWSGRYTNSILVYTLWSRKVHPRHPVAALSQLELAMARSRFLVHSISRQAVRVPSSSRNPSVPEISQSLRTGIVPPAA